jgi:hypothetical protein
MLTGFDRRAWAQVRPRAASSKRSWARSQRGCRVLSGQHQDEDAAVVLPRDIRDIFDTAA